MERTVFCGQIPPMATEEFMHILFTLAGAVEKVFVQPPVGEKQGYALIMFFHGQSADRALVHFQGMVCEGHVFIMRRPFTNAIPYGIYMRQYKVHPDEDLKVFVYTGDELRRIGEVAQSSRQPSFLMSHMMDRTVFCGQIPPMATEEFMHILFTLAGAVEKVFVQPPVGDKQGYALIMFFHGQSADRALANFQGMTCEDHLFILRRPNSNAIPYGIYSRQYKVNLDEDLKVFVYTGAELRRIREVAQPSRQPSFPMWVPINYEYSLANTFLAKLFA